MQKGPRRDCPVGEVDKSCRWSKRGSGKCRGPAPQAKATSEVMDFVADLLTLMIRNLTLTLMNRNTCLCPDCHHQCHQQLTISADLIIPLQLWSEKF